jgi:alpha-L-rhamnosidase
MVKLFSVFSGVLGEREKQAVYQRKSEEIRKAIRAEFLKDSGKALKGMTALAAVLYFDIAEKEEKTEIYSRLVDLIEEERYRALFGILGAKYVHNVLCEMGRADVFIKMMECNEYPSFGVWLTRGATTLWEDFEGANSRNHHMFADISSVMQTYLLGVKQTNENGRYCLKIEPYLDAFDSLNGSVSTVNGKVVAEYTVTDAN